MDLLVTTIGGDEPELREFWARRGSPGIDPAEEVICASFAGRLVGCLRMDDGLVTEVALDDDCDQSAVAEALLAELNLAALERGRFGLFVHCPPHLVDVFRAGGFHALAAVGGEVVLLENSPVGLSRYLAGLSARRWVAGTVAGVVLPEVVSAAALRLVTTALRDCDFVHVLPSASASDAMLERLAARLEQLPGAERLCVHAPSVYVSSRITGSGGRFEALDHQLFRRFVGPALGITHRYVGAAEPLRHWLQEADLPEPSITLIEVASTGHGPMFEGLGSRRPIEADLLGAVQATVVSRRSA